MDFDAFFRRPSLEGSPVSVLIRFVPRTEVIATVHRGLKLLANRSRGDELVLLVDFAAPTHLPARINGTRIKLLRSASPHSGETLSDAIDACLHEAIVITDAELAIEPPELNALLGQLNEADIVTTRRPGRSHGLLKTLLAMVMGLLGGFVGYWVHGWQSPLTGFSVSFFGMLLLLNLAAVVRYVFGVPVSDPGSPVKAVRKRATSGIPLQCNGYLAETELIAKLTFLTTLIGEVPIQALMGPVNWLELVDGQWGRLFHTMVFPRFWRFNSKSPQLHPTPLEMSLPAEESEPSASPRHLETRPFGIPAPKRDRHSPIVHGSNWGPAYPRNQWRPAGFRARR